MHEHTEENGRVVTDPARYREALLRGRNGVSGTNGMTGMTGMSGTTEEDEG